MASWQVKGLQLFAALSILILLHELGHFLFAKLFKTKVEKFYLFFDFLFPFSNLLPFSIFKKKIGETTYGMGWFPLGGYVKIAGMVDESMDKDAMKLPPQPWEYRSKKSWQKLFIMLGGIIMNILTAMVIYAFIFGHWGESYLRTDAVTHGIWVDSLGKSIGLENGDKIVSVDGKKVERFNKIPLEIIFNDAQTLQINRGGQELNIEIPNGTIRNLLKNQKGGFVSPRLPAVIGQVVPESIAEKNGLKVFDSVIAINGTPIRYFDEFQEKRTQLEGQPMTVLALRNGNDTVLSTMTIPTDSMMGIAVAGFDRFYEIEKKNYGFGEAIAKGFSYTFEQVGSYWKQIELLFTSDEVKFSESVGGIGTFAKAFPASFDWQAFWMFTAFISIILAVMNLLPIPGLDGGYVFFLLIEMITGRKVSDKVMEITTTIGLVLLLALMVYANGLDVVRLFK